MLREVMTQRAEMIGDDNLQFQTMQKEVMSEIEGGSRNTFRWRRCALLAAACLAAVAMVWRFFPQGDISPKPSATSPEASDVAQHGVMQLRMPQPERGMSERPTIPDKAGGPIEPESQPPAGSESRPTYDELLAASIEMSETDTVPRVPDELRMRNPIEANVAMTEAIYRRMLTIEIHK